MALDLDFSLLKAPDYVGDYVNAFNAGRLMARQAGVDGAALTPTPQPPPASVLLSRLSPPQQQAAAGRAEILAALGRGLASRPYDERRAILGYLAPRLGAFGPPAQIAGFDPTDANLAAVVGQAEGLRALLADQASRPASLSEAQNPSPASGTKAANSQGEAQAVVAGVKARDRPSTLAITPAAAAPAAEPIS